MFERTQARMLPIANRAADHVPVATACCNVCRTCVQTNIVGLLLTGIVGLGAFMVPLWKPGKIRPTP